MAWPTQQSGDIESLKSKGSNELEQTDNQTAWPDRLGLCQQFVRCLGRCVYYAMAIAAVWLYLQYFDWFVHDGPLGIGWKAAPREPSPPPKLDWRCLYPIGGGPSRPGSDFQLPEAARHKCLLTIAHYLEQQYDEDVNVAIGEAQKWFNHTAAAKKPDGKQLVVFDIDETALCNIKSEVVDWRPLHAASDPLPILRQWQLRGESPPLQPTLKLYTWLWRRGYSVTFITGRAEHVRESTEHNLAAAGYGRQCAKEQLGAPRGDKDEPCYVQLDLRAPSDAGLSATLYKGGRRQRLVEEGGYTIVGSFGDQFSDLSGLAMADSSWKLPNPVYYIL